MLDIVKTVNIDRPYSFSKYPQLFLKKCQDDPQAALHYENEWRRLIQTEKKLLPILIENKSKSFKLFSSSEIEEISIHNILSSIGFNLDLHTFYSDIKDEYLSLVTNLLHGLCPTFSIDPFESLIKTIIRQLISANLAKQIVGNLVRRFGDHQEIGSRNYYNFPTPSLLLSASKNDLIETKVGFKWKLILKVTEDVYNGDLDLFEFSKKSSSEVYEILNSYKGIGDWTARVFLSDGLKRLDEYPSKDMTLKKVVEKIYFNNKEITYRQLDSFLPDKHRGLTIFYIMASYLTPLYKSYNQIEQYLR